MFKTYSNLTTPAAPLVPVIISSSLSMAVAFLVSLSSSLFFVRVLATHYCEPFSSVSHIPVVVTLIVKAKAHSDFLCPLMASPLF